MSARAKMDGSMIAKDNANAVNNLASFDMTTLYIFNLYSKHNNGIRRGYGDNMVIRG